MIGPIRIYRILACLAAVAVFAPASAQRPLDLAGPRTVERSVTAGARITFELINIVPSERSAYTISIRQEVLPIEPLPFSFTGLAGSPRGQKAGCIDGVRVVAALLNTASSEASVRRIVANARMEVLPGCAEDLETLIRNATTFALDDAFILRPNQRLVVEISRGEHEWRFVFRTEPRGEWRTGYGFTFVPRVYPQYYTEQIEDDPTNFIVRRERGNRRSDPLTNYDFLPSILFTWLPQEARYGNWNGGITAGLGYDLSSVAVFGGLSATHNENVTFAAGLAIHQQPRLAPGFEPGEIVGQPLSSEALHVPRFGPNLFFGVSFRFGRNPFSDLSDDADAEEDVLVEERPEPDASPREDEEPVGEVEGEERGEDASDDDAIEVNADSDVGASFGAFTLKSIDTASDPRVLVFDAAGGAAEISGPYAPRDGTHCIAPDSASTARMPWFHAPPELLCLSVPDAAKGRIEALSAGDELTVKITGFRIRYAPGQPTAIYDQATVSEVVAESDEG